MNFTDHLPAWAFYVVTVGSPVAAFLGVLFANWVTRSGQREAERRSRREEVMRNVRWSAELAVHSDGNKAELGVAVLNSLSQSNLSDEDVQKLIESALNSVVGDVVDEIEQTEVRGSIAVVRLAQTESIVPGPSEATEVDFETDRGNGGEADG